MSATPWIIVLAGLAASCASPIRVQDDGVPNDDHREGIDGADAGFVPDADFDDQGDSESATDTSSPVDTGPPALRLVSPGSTSLLGTTRPRCSWLGGTAGSAITIDLCRDRGCATPLHSFVSSTGTLDVPVDLETGAWFWRAREVGPTSVPMAVWEFFVSPRIVPSVAPISVLLDLNGDGRNDLVFGDWGLGQVRVFFGRATGFPSDPDRILADPAGGGTEYGRQVAAAGDVNGDGYGELLVAARAGAGARGELHVYFGGPTGPSALPDVTLTGPVGPILFGQSVAGLGDVNGDGYADIATATGSGADAGRAYVYLGSSLGPRPDPDAAFSVSTSPDGFGGALSGVGDVNADGLADFAIGAPNIDAVFVYLGTPSQLGRIVPIRLHDTGRATQIGISVAAAGDVTGDGIADLIVGANNDGGAAGGVGCMAIYAGSRATFAETAVTVVCGEDGDTARFGWAVSGGGDFNGDGRADVVVGETGPSVHVFTSGPTGLSTVPLATITGSVADFGSAVRFVGDADGDGRTELLVGTRGPSASGDGWIYLFSPMPNPMMPTLLQTWHLGVPGSRFGGALADSGAFRRRSSERDTFGARIATGSGGQLHDYPNLPPRPLGPLNRAVDVVLRAGHASNLNDRCGSVHEPRG